MMDCLEQKFKNLIQNINCVYPSEAQELPSTSKEISAHVRFVLILLNNTIY